MFVRVVDPSSTIFCCRRWDRIETLSTPQPGRLQVLGTSFPPYYTTQPAAIGPRTGCVRILPGRGSTEGAEGCVRSSWCSLLIFVSNRPTISSSAASASGGGMDPGGWMRGTDRSTNNTAATATDAATEEDTAVVGGCSPCPPIRIRIRRIETVFSLTIILTEHFYSGRIKFVRHVNKWVVLYLIVKKQSKKSIVTVL